jgi:hypothetical protein
MLGSSCGSEGQAAARWTFFEVYTGLLITSERRRRSGEIFA